MEECDCLDKDMLADHRLSTFTRLFQNMSQRIPPPGERRSRQLSMEYDSHLPKNTGNVYLALLSDLTIDQKLWKANATIYFFHRALSRLIKIDRSIQQYYSGQSILPNSKQLLKRAYFEHCLHCLTVRINKAGILGLICYKVE